MQSHYTVYCIRERVPLTCSAFAEIHESCWLFDLDNFDFFLVNVPAQLFLLILRCRDQVKHITDNKTFLPTSNGVGSTEDKTMEFLKQTRKELDTC